MCTNNEPLIGNEQILVYNIIHKGKRIGVFFDEKMAERINLWLNKMDDNQMLLITKDQAREIYDDGANNIDCDGCPIDPPDEDFEDTIKSL